CGLGIFAEALRVAAEARGLALADEFLAPDLSAGVAGEIAVARLQPATAPIAHRSPRSPLRRRPSCGAIAHGPAAKQPRNTLKPANALRPELWQESSIRRVLVASFVQTALAPPAGSSAIAIESARLRFAFGTAEQKMPKVQMPPTCVARESSNCVTTCGLVT